MKYYLIYTDKGKYLGFSDNKKYVKNFLKNRKGTYKICKIDDKEIPDNIKNSFEFEDNRLTEYVGYYTDADTILFYKEYIDMEQYMSADAFVIMHIASELKKSSKSLVLSDDERKLIDITLSNLIEFVSNITNTDEVIYDEVFDIRKYFYERYLKMFPK